MSIVQNGIQLAISVVLNDHRAARRLLDNGTDPGSIWNINEVPLGHGLVLNGQHEMLRIVASRGLPMDELWYMVSAVELAYAIGDTDAVQILKDAGADVSRIQPDRQQDLNQALLAMERHGAQGSQIQDPMVAQGHGR